MRQIQLTNHDLIAVEREYCSRSLANFARRAWSVLEPATALKWGWAVDAICEHLEAVTNDEILRLLMNVPPGTMKSLLTSVIWPAWEWGPKDLPHLRYLGTAHKQDLAVRDSTKCRRLIQSQWYQSLWPITLTGDQNAKTKFENTSTGFREAMAFTSMTGARGHRVILDDPHSVDDANSAVKMANDIVTFREALPSRVNDEHSAITIIMQRLAVGDIADIALELGYAHLCIPMRYEEGRSKHVVGAGDPRKVEGELMFSERFPRDQVEQLEKSLGTHATAGQLQQRPHPRGGRIIKTNQFILYNQLPIIEYRVIYGDTAQKAKESNDYSVFQCWGYSFGKIYLIDQMRGKWEAPELERMAIMFWNKHKAIDGLGALRRIKIEDKASGTGLIQSLRTTHKLPIVGIQRSTDKYSRVMDVLSYIEAGLVHLPGDAPWLLEFLQECEAFTANDTHPFDDQIDPMIDAITDMFSNSADDLTGFSMGETMASAADY